ncbi:vWA domain-containing protein [Nonomuraea longicatena]|uniref:VWA domain-containing protein n=1 Tax=Nonomuraea longicatena TaxID=83682 RepID=A0ABP4BIY1_9ACTN
MSLIERHTGFVNALREAGMPVSVAEGLDAARALRVVELTDRESLRAAYAATLIKRPGYRDGFDVLFDLWFPPSTTGLYAEGPQPADPRSHLAELLRTGADTRAFARAMVDRFGRREASPGRQRWFSYSVLAALSPQTLIAGILRESAQDALAQKAARRAVTDGIRRFEEAVAADVRRRIAEDAGIERIARSAVRPPPERLDFLRATGEDLARLRREVHPLARRLATRLATRHRRGRHGRLDFRRTVRASLQSGGVPLTTVFRPPRPHRPELVVLCDTSDSVSAFAQFTLLLTYALRERFTKVRAFGFVDRVDEITRFFAPGADMAESMAALAREADMVRFGRTDYGRAFEGFLSGYGDAIGPKTSLLILGDARTNYRPPATEALRTMAGRARRAYWLNPEPVAQWDTGDSVASEYAAVVPMHECRDVAQLSAFIETIT